VTTTRGLKAMRVAFFEPYPDRFGGSHQVTMLLAQALRARNVDVAVMTPKTGPMTERLSTCGIPWSVTALPSSLMVYGHQTRGWKAVKAAASLPKAWLALFRRLRGSADLLHINNLRGMLLLGPAARAARIPVVWHVHLADPQPIANRFAAALASAIVTPSAAVARDLPGVPFDRVRIVPNCVPPDAAGLTPSTDRDPRLIVTATRMTPQKGVDVLLGSLVRVLEDEPGARFVVYGSPQLGYEAFNSEIHQTVANLNLAANVEFLGEVEKPYLHWVDAAVYVQPSRFEILPMAILEAMAVGLPVVATDVGGVSDLVVNGVTGILVPPEDPGRLAEAVTRLIREPDTALRMGTAGRQRAARFSLTEMTDQILRVYSSVGAECRP
jgi:glycosyltransferase involved in cell wall biosynthesis